jgi:hypothetical protein
MGNARIPTEIVLIQGWQCLMLTCELAGQGKEAMPINWLLLGGKIMPEEFQRLDRAFTFTLKSMSLVDRNDPISEIVARKVIEIDAAGIHDPKEIAKLAAKQLGIP